MCDDIGIQLDRQGDLLLIRRGLWSSPPPAQYIVDGLRIRIGERSGSNGRVLLVGHLR